MKAEEAQEAGPPRPAGFQEAARREHQSEAAALLRSQNKVCNTCQAFGRVSGAFSAAVPSHTIEI